MWNKNGSKIVFNKCNWDALSYSPGVKNEKV